MKATLFAAALALTASAAFAQTVAPGTTPGAQTGTPSNMPSAGTNSTVATDPTANNPRMDNMSSSDRKAMRKSKKMKSNDGTMKTKTKM
ncbi:MAG: hypothetical protein ACRYF0_00375 [Janthinobacterium lividum]